MKIIAIVHRSGPSQHLRVGAFRRPGELHEIDSRTARDGYRLNTPFGIAVTQQGSVVLSDNRENAVLSIE
jgi:hypothetical protein